MSVQPGDASDEPVYDDYRFNYRFILGPLSGVIVGKGVSQNVARCNSDCTFHMPNLPEACAHTQGNGGVLDSLFASSGNLYIATSLLSDWVYERGTP